MLGTASPMQPLLSQLRQLGMQVDVAADLAAVRTLFFGAGGHDCLVIAPEVQPRLAQRVLTTLRTIDPELATATFGPNLDDQATPARSARLQAFHPGSRAGAGALLRFLRGIPLR